MPRYHVDCRDDLAGVDHLCLFRYSTIVDQPSDVIVVPVAELDERIDDILFAVRHGGGISDAGMRHHLHSILSK